jgi:hypothetical protein
MGTTGIFRNRRIKPPKVLPRHLSLVGGHGERVTETPSNRVEIAMSTTHKNNPDPSVIITKAIDEVASSADSLEEALGPATRVMTPDDKRRALRVRKGAHLVTQTIATLAKTYGLDSTALHSDQMLALVQKAGTLSARRCKSA